MNTNPIERGFTNRVKNNKAIANVKQLTLSVFKQLLIKKTDKTNINIKTDSDKSLYVMAKFPTQNKKSNEMKKALFLFNLSEAILQIKKIVENQQDKLTIKIHLKIYKFEQPNNKGNPLMMDINKGRPSSNFISKYNFFAAEKQLPSSPCKVS